MLIKFDTSKPRLRVFRHLDVIMTAKTTYILSKKRGLVFILKHNKVALNDLATLRIHLLKGKN